MRLFTDHRSKFTEEREKNHSSNHEFISIYLPHFIMDTKCSWKTAGQFWAITENKNGCGGCKKQMF